jgi:Ser/Thr protein kinase RdoA (MazF antagonist)
VINPTTTDPHQRDRVYDNDIDIRFTIFLTSDTKHGLYPLPTSLPAHLPTVYSVLSLTALHEVLLANYPLSPSSTLRFWQAAQSGGNDIYLVQLADAKYILRVYLHGTFPESMLAAQITLLNDLASRNLPVTRVIPRTDGTFIQPIDAPEGLRYAILTEFAEGTAPGGLITAEQSHRYGQAIAQLHRTADSLPTHYPLPIHATAYLIDAPRAVLHSNLNADDDWQLIRTTMNNLPHIAPVYGLCHGDPHKSNFLYADGDLTLIDFDCVGYGYRAYDLAVFRWSTARPTRMGGLEPDRADTVWQSFLAGYREIYTLDQATLDAVPSFVLARHLWWMAIDVAKIRDGLIGGSWLNADWWAFQRGILDDLRRQLPSSP